MKNFIELNANEVEEVNGAWVLAAATIIGGAMAIVYAGEVAHDLLCKEHG